ncbi:hypothetical protein [Endozoicomonas sp.]|uniref:hypothetical protein n=1 Tax=Endozoicomonas sp. TaxID=1892382 RepID=UPI003AF894F0
MDISADEIDDLLFWTLQQSWPVEQHLVAFASQQIGYVNNEGNCGLRYPESGIHSGLLPGQVAVHHWRHGEYLAISEVAYLNAMAQFLRDRGENGLADSLPPPESRRRECLLLDLSGASTVSILVSCLKKQLGLLYNGGGMAGIKQAMMDDRLSNMPRCLVIEGLGFIEGFLPATCKELMDIIASYRSAFPDRNLTLREDSPSGEGRSVVQLF